MARKSELRNKLGLSNRMTAESGDPGRLAAPTSAMRPVKAVPLHEQIHREMMDLIASGTWPAGSVLPSERDLAQMLGVAVGTVRRAMSDLVTDGIVARRPRTGTVVTGRMPQLNLKESYRYFRLHGPGDTLARSRNKIFNYFQRPCDRKEQDILNLDPGEMVHQFERIRLVDNVPVMHDLVVFPVKSAPDIASEDDIPPTLAIYFLEKFGIRITAQRERLSAEMATDYDREVLDRSGVFPVLVIEEIAFDQMSDPVLIGVHRAVTENFKYINEIK